MADDPVFEKLANFRQPGGRGLTNKHGQTVKDGILYRCSRPDSVTRRDATLFQQLGIKTIFDLRQPSDHQRDGGNRLLYEFYQECELRGDEVVSTAAHSAGRYIGRYYHANLLVEGRLFESFLQLKYSSRFMRLMVSCAVVPLYICDKIFKTNFARKFTSRYILQGTTLCQLYLMIADTSKPMIACVLRQIIKPTNRPSVICCSLGKDRTGILIALILSCLDVSEEDIVQDYARSKDGLIKLKDSIYHIMVVEMGLPVEWVGAEPETMREMLRQLNQKYGSVSDYLVSAGFTLQEQDQLRDCFLDM